MACVIGEHLETLTFSYGTEAALRKELGGAMLGAILRKKRAWVREERDPRMLFE